MRPKPHSPSAKLLEDDSKTVPKKNLSNKKNPSHPPRLDTTKRGQHCSKTNLISILEFNYTIIDSKLTKINEIRTQKPDINRQINRIRKNSPRQPRFNTSKRGQYLRELRHNSAIRNWANKWNPDSKIREKNIELLRNCPISPLPNNELEKLLIELFKKI